MTPLFATEHDTDASQLRASGRRYACRLVPAELLGDTWASQGSQRLTRHPERLHRADSAPPTATDNEPPTRVMSVDEIAEVLSCS